MTQTQYPAPPSASTAPDVPAPEYVVCRRNGRRFCFPGKQRQCPCCGDDLLADLALREPPEKRPRGKLDSNLEGPEEQSERGEAGGRGAVDSGDTEWLSARDAADGLVGFVDTHCHLEETLQVMQRVVTVPSLNKLAPYELNDEEHSHWHTLGWLLEVFEDGSAAEPVRAAEEAAAVDVEAEKEEAAEEEDDGGYGWIQNPTVWSPMSSSLNPVYSRSWADLSAAQRDAAASLGWTKHGWEKGYWPLQSGDKWWQMPEGVRKALELLGETEKTWDMWHPAGSSKASSSTAGKLRKKTKVKAESDMRDWNALSDKEQVAAAALGFRPGTWNQSECHDFHEAARVFFGPGFQGCLTQGIDVDSFAGAQRLALKYPQVYASFGCHPKSSLFYDSKMEGQILACLDACGKKAVAWGEFGLDFSHAYYGKSCQNRRIQKEVFCRQLTLALQRQLPLVIHSRDADRDTLRVFSAHVPRHWRCHIHSYRGGVPLMEVMLDGWTHVYFGFSGLVTMGDPQQQDLIRNCPLDRMLLETDAPYLPVYDTSFSHPGHVVAIARAVAELKGVTTKEVLMVTRENARVMYGF
eukprot:TRINITY_DN12313_c0_g1_i2.p1 TRINITY_DN12313_c0_g1~~TRINITY_DN12313_c0_g1_i2.p1  ORF type:complete len:579 (+),score=137.41 TRINITY_DN12313_c0_g1_i2:134-1870(+)